MADVKLLGYSVSEMSFVNNIQKTETFELTNRCSYNLGFAQNRLCRGEMTAAVFNKNHPKSLCLKATLVGHTVREDDAPQDDVHRTTYKMLFPHVKAIITSLTVAANVPPIFFPDINIDGQSVYMMENPKKI